MVFYEHTCEECPRWDDINGCWAGHGYPKFGPNHMACPDYAGDDYGDDLDIVEAGWDTAKGGA